MPQRNSSGSKFGNGNGRVSNGSPQRNSNDPTANGRFFWTFIPRAGAV